MEVNRLIPSRKHYESELDPGHLGGRGGAQDGGWSLTGDRREEQLQTGRPGKLWPSIAFRKCGVERPVFKSWPVSHPNCVCWA